MRFTQLDRPLFALTPAEASADRLDRYAKRRVGFARLVQRLVSRGWYQMEESGYQRDFVRDDVIAHVNLYAGAACDVYLRRGRFWKDRQFDMHHPVTISEILYDLDFAHGLVAK